MKRNAVAWTSLVVSVAALVGSRGLSRPIPAAPSVPAESQKVARALSEAFEAVADFVKPSVVQISVQRKAGSGLRIIPGPGGRRMPFPGPDGSPLNPKDFKDFEEMLRRFLDPDFKHEKEQFGGGHLAEGTGSGFVYDDQGHILTNNHVVDGAGKITVTFHDGIEASATVVGTDKDTDVAVIKVDNTSYRPLPRGSSGKLRVGDLVMAVGSPFGLSQTVTTGIISATERNDVQINSYESFLQTDAAINPGNSGGPLVSMDGRVVGINSAIVTGSRGNDGVGFAIPIDMAANVADKLIKDGKVSRARIGIALGPLTPAMAKQLGIDPKTKGVLCNEVLPGGPAEKAGLKAGDVITSFNGQPVVNIPAFRLNVAASDVGRSYTLTYLRNGEEHTTSIVPAPSDKVVFEQEKESSAEPEARSETAKTSISDFGLEVQPLTSELARSLGMSTDLQGLLISSVKEGSPAEAAGLEEGQVITKVVTDRKIQPVKTVKEFQDLAGKTDELAVYVQSTKGPSRFVTLSKKKD
ncbi:MAG: trypsin-like peptidase domain-containing protein [Planctomycetaceae bacterium]|nr:trypsin-like peptidase domain-containing protein [Planctomycetaceae bacterium]